MTKKKAPEPDLSTPPVDDKDAENIEAYGHETQGETDSNTKKTS